MKTLDLAANRMVTHTNADLMNIVERSAQAPQHSTRIHTQSGSHGSLSSTLTHVSQSGEARMVDVSGKLVTRREAVARAEVALGPTAFRLVQQNKAKKGDVLGVARVAGIMAAKRTSELIPLCHPLPLDSIEVNLTLREYEEEESEGEWRDRRKGAATEAREHEEEESQGEQGDRRERNLDEKEYKGGESERDTKGEGSEHKEEENERERKEVRKNTHDKRDREEEHNRDPQEGRENTPNKGERKSSPVHLVTIEAKAVISGRTGVEMEALVAASVAALTVYDMCKAVSHAITISKVRLVAKSGGKRDYKAKV